jgi:hypothetical protein
VFFTFFINFKLTLHRFFFFFLTNKIILSNKKIEKYVVDQELWTKEFSQLLRNLRPEIIYKQGLFLKINNLNR